MCPLGWFPPLYSSLMCYDLFYTIRDLLHSPSKPSLWVRVVLLVPAWATELLVASQRAGSIGELTAGFAVECA